MKKYQVFIIILLLSVFANNAFAGLGIKGAVGVSNLGGGYVYESTEEMDITDITEWRKNMCAWGNSAPPNGTIYWIYAKPEEGKQFEGWYQQKLESLAGDVTFYSSSPKVRMTYKDSENYQYMAYFKPITDPKICNVPRDITVYVDNSRVERDGNGNIFIPKGKSVKVTWSGAYLYSPSPETPYTPGFLSINFTMPDYDITLISQIMSTNLLCGVPTSFKVHVEGEELPTQSSGVYPIEPEKYVIIEISDGYRCEIYPDIASYHTENMIVFTMPYDDVVMLNAIEDVSLYEEGYSNNDIITSRLSNTCDVTLRGRTLWKDGNWNTICLPFDYPLNKAPLEGCIVKELYDASYNKDTKTLNLEFMDTYYNIIAGKPYLIKWDNENTGIWEPQFTDVVFTSSSPDSVVVDSMIAFKGSFEAISLSANDRKKLYLGEYNTLYFPKENVPLNAFRSYFQLQGNLTAGDNYDGGANSIQTFFLNFGDDNTTLTSIENNKRPMLNNQSNDTWYDLSGRKIANGRLPNGMPKGVYISNGKKTVVK